ncbi:MAG: hypothetical protein HC849_05780 [Oscillatoriales cyanobacterium RU_3_3]|nr:hypothetical protein [Microcoleus sp. SM1_3_4]NJM59810.1 hypothetical protein [Oscillatoriales cyanobacterium RU_3_3]NJS10332.1 hypothetical protein [Microcoleus sp. CSU_2_2]
MRITRKRPLRNGRQRQTAGADRDRTLNNNRMRANNPATLNNDRNAGQGFSEPALAPEWAELNDGLTMNATERLKKNRGETAVNAPDLFNYAIVGVLGTFYVASLISTYISSNLLLYLLSGGAGIAVPMFGSQVPITEAVALMGSGILEGTSLSDAYLDHKKQLKGSRQWMSRGGRFLAFIAQGLLYYMALGQLLFATADVSSLGTQGLKGEENSAAAESTLVLEPPTVLHGAFVGTISFAWSFGATYIGSTALLVAIDRLRRGRGN